MVVGAVFSIEYRDGSITRIEFRTAEIARLVYELYDLEPEDDAKGWGWEEVYSND